MGIRALAFYSEKQLWCLDMLRALGLSYDSAGVKMQVDAQTLQFQNQQLEIKLDVQRNEINALEGKLNQLRSKQTSFDDNLSIVNRVWNQVRLQVYGIRS